MKEHPIYKGYWIRRNGEIISTKRPNPIKLKMGLNKQGYYHLTICMDSVKKTKTVHSLVLETYVGKRPKGMQARHLNGNCKDNRVCNLAWGTFSENVLDKCKHNKKKIGEYKIPKRKRKTNLIDNRNKFGTKHQRSKFTAEQVRQIRKMFKTHIVPEIAENFNAYPGTIFNIKRGMTYRDVK